MHVERHSEATGWLRAAILGANDGVLSTASLVAGVAAAAADKPAILIAGVAGLTAGALSMAAGEYVSVSSQSDAERANIAKETQELQANPEGELAELACIYRQRGLDPELADAVARQLTASGALEAHLRDELGMQDITRARPVQAAAFSAVSFALGAAVPVVVAWLSPADIVLPLVYAFSLLALGLFGGVGAKVGGAAPIRPVVRIVALGALAMAVTSAVGYLFGVQA